MGNLITYLSRYSVLESLPIIRDMCLAWRKPNNPQKMPDHVLEIKPRTREVAKKAWKKSDMGPSPAGGSSMGIFLFKQVDFGRRRCKGLEDW